MYDPKDCRVVHETIIKDIVDVLTSVKDFDEIEFELGKNKSFKSIASASSNLTLVFPVVVSTDMDITSAMMISKAIERKCVAMLQMLFSAFTINDARDAMSYIAKFHTNMRMNDNMDLDTFVSYVDDFVNKMEESAPITVDRTKYEAVREDMKRNMNYYLDMNCISEHSINEYSVLPASKYGKMVVTEAKKYNDNSTDNSTNFKGNNNRNRTYRGDDRSMFAGDGGMNVQNMNNINVPDTANITTSNTTRSYNYRINRDDRAANLKNQYEMFSKQILDSDIKKANELMPTMMIVNFVTENKEGGDCITNSAVIGVKAKMYPVSSLDIIDRIKAKNKDNNGFNNFIRATTREISFWKDFVFAIDKAKIDALSSSRRGSSSPIWKLLERRALKSRIRRTFRMTNDATAITTLVMSQNEAEYLMKNENINIMNATVARTIMESFNLLSISIVDESIEVARFIFDTGDDDYESLTFSALERESSDNTYKRVVNLMTKMSR